MLYTVGLQYSKFGLFSLSVPWASVQRQKGQLDSLWSKPLCEGRWTDVSTHPQLSEMWSAPAANWVQVNVWMSFLHCGINNNHSLHGQGSELIYLLESTSVLGWHKHVSMKILENTIDFIFYWMSLLKLCRFQHKGFLVLEIKIKNALLGPTSLKWLNSLLFVPVSMM